MKKYILATLVVYSCFGMDRARVEGLFKELANTLKSCDKPQEFISELVSYLVGQCQYAVAPDSGSGAAPAATQADLETDLGPTGYTHETLQAQYKNLRILAIEFDVKDAIEQLDMLAQVHPFLTK